MKYLFLTLALTFSMGAQSKEQDVCGAIGELAEGIMKAHQIGVPMSKIVEGGNELVEAMAIDAYSRPRYSTERMQNRAVAEFRDAVYLMCIKEQRAKA